MNALNGAGRKPMEINAHGVRVKIYRSARKVGGKVYPYFRVAFHEPGFGRRLRDFGAEADAIAEAKSIAVSLGSGRNDAATLSRDEVAEFNLCRSRLEGTGFSIFQAVEGFLAHQSANQIEPKGVPEVVAEYLAELKARNLSAAYIAHERQVGQKLVADFRCPLASVTPARYRPWLLKLRLRNGGAMSGCYRRNVHRSFCALMSFAARRNYVTRDHAAQIADVETPKPSAPRCDVFTPDEFAKLLEAAGDDVRPAIVLGGFCGLRTAEIGRIQWADVNLAERVVVVGAHIAKTQSRRVVPLCDAAVQWLTPYTVRTGPVLPVDDRHIAAVGVVAGVPWKKNGLRHAFASCRLAVLKNAAEVAFECGNSTVMIQKHYRSLVTESQGRAWFAIIPRVPNNVIPLHAEG
ncbi:MAG: tyrosine-type recombinase/integrase [Verrucomicrobiales bacterium]|nr:tyrosine-type recombinase/integrase [Verrucomicrobiales bacterium]